MDRLISRLANHFHFYENGMILLTCHHEFPTTVRLMWDFPAKCRQFKRRYAFCPCPLTCVPAGDEKVIQLIAIPLKNVPEAAIIPLKNVPEIAIIPSKNVPEAVIIPLKNVPEAVIIPLKNVPEAGIIPLKIVFPILY
ncbi:MAG: hypothetical protein IKO65_00035 [Victivallales bacterium]|nr:hypothetical protein [Victivallales bacterium]